MTHAEQLRARERELVQAAKRGDATAFEDLVEPYQKKAYAFALRQTGDPDVAEDVCQDALIKAFTNIGSFAGKSAFSTWLFRIIHTTFLDHIKRERIRTTTPLLENGEAPEGSQRTLARFREQLRSQEREEWLLAGVFKLSPEFRAVIVLRDLQGFSYKEIAKIIGAAEGTAKSRISRAREQLRQILTGSGRTSAKRK